MSDNVENEDVASLVLCRLREASTRLPPDTLLPTRIKVIVFPARLTRQEKRGREEAAYMIIKKLLST